MRLHYCRTRSGNFGDDLNPWLWPRLAPGLLDDDASVDFLGIGTLLNDSLAPGPRRIVFSSGSGYGRPPRLDGSWTISCVRGPRTAAELGLPTSAAVTDGAALVATLPLPPARPSGRVAFMPHHRSVEVADWAALCASIDCDLIDPRRPVDEVLGQIGSARLLLAEALHGAIVADALRVPWVAVSAGSYLYSFKWEDWCASLDLAYRPQVLPLLQQVPLAPAARLRNGFKLAAHRLGVGKDKWQRLPWRVHGPERTAAVAERLRAIAASAPPQLSDERLLQARIDELRTRLEVLRRRAA